MAGTTKVRSTAEAKKNTLYCSFCGKSQHDVTKLIAGPSVFICDECTDLCDDILWTDTENRIAIKVRIPSGSAYDDILNDVLGKTLSEAFPEYDVEYEFRTPDRAASRSSGMHIAVYTISSKVEDGEVLKRQVSSLANKLAVLNQKFLHESERAKRINEELVILKDEYLSHLRAEARKMKEAQSDLRAVMFLDVSGFSKFTLENKQSVVDMLRGITPPLLADRGANDINMWGDAIVATFEDPNQAIGSAIKFLRHLSVEQLDARIGMSWGVVRMNYNPATGRKDIDSPIVDFAARLEPMAKLGSILCSREFGALDIDDSLYELLPVKMEIKKDFADKKAGDLLDLLEVKYLKN